MGNGLFFKSFMRYFPLLLALLIICNIFDIFGRFLGYFGLSRFRFNEESTNEKIEYGKKLLSKGMYNCLMFILMNISSKFEGKDWRLIYKRH